MAELIEDQFTDRAIVARRDGSEVLLLADARGWALPQCTTRGRHPADVTNLCRELRDRLGVGATVLRCVDVATHENDGTVSRVYEMEARADRWTPPPTFRWFRLSDVDALALTPADRAAVQAWRALGAQREIVDGREWMLAGWWNDATGWINHQLAHRGEGTIQSIEQVRAWEFSCVLRVRSDQGEVYFKALPHSLAMEPRLTDQLAAVHPQWVADVVATDAQRRWLLTRSCRGAALEEITDVSLWERAATSFARLQRLWTGRVAELTALGCTDRRLPQLAADIAPLLRDDGALLVDQPAGLSAADIDRLRARAPRLEEMCAELATYAVPASIEHGDFWPGNIFADATDCRIIDWTDACVSHPFFSVCPLFNSGVFEGRLAHVADARTRIRDAYLEPWTRHESPDRLRQAFDLAQTLAAVHYAVSYWRLLPLVGTQWWLPRMVPFFLRQLDI